MNFLDLISSDKIKRKNNKYIEILSYIWDNDGISRHELATLLNISRVSITRNIDQLLEWGMIEIGSGRRSVPISLKKDLFYSIGVNFHRRHSEITLLNAHSEVISSVPIEDNQKVWTDKCDFVVSSINKLLEEENLSLQNIIGIGITLPGIVNIHSGEVLHSSSFKGSSNFNIVEYLKEKTNLPTHLINMAHLLAYTEKKWGYAQEMDSFLVLHEGLGLGMLLNGKLYRGHQFNSGDFGYIQVPHNGEIGSDGRVGSLESVAPFYKLRDHLENIIEKGSHTGVNKYLKPGETSVTLEMIVKAIEDGDQLCSRMMSQNFETIGNAILSLAYIFCPEAIFLPPWTARCQTSSIDTVKRIMGHYGVNNWHSTTKILPAKVEEKMLSRAAGLIPVDRFFNNPDSLLSANR